MLEVVEHLRATLNYKSHPCCPQEVPFLDGSQKLKLQQLKLKLFNGSKELTLQQLEEIRHSHKKICRCEAKMLNNMYTYLVIDFIICSPFCFGSCLVMTPYDEHRVLSIKQHLLMQRGLSSEEPSSDSFISCMDIIHR